MPYSTDLGHFDGVLAPGSTAPAPARRLAKFLTDIVSIATRETDDGTIDTDVKCFKRPQRRACPGRITAMRQRGDDAIHWRCPSCGEWGVINGWHGSDADLSQFAQRLTEVVPLGARSDPNQAVFLGRWRITDMELWSQDAFDLVAPAFFRFDQDQLGELLFIAVTGGLDCRYGVRDGQPLVEFTWEGDDEGDQRCGRGWATVLPDGTLSGRFFFHRGDDSAFTAKKERTAPALRR